MSAPSRVLVLLFFILGVGLGCADTGQSGFNGSTDADGSADGTSDLVGDPDSDGDPDRGGYDQDPGEMLEIGQYCTADDECASGLCLFLEAGIEEGICTWFCSNSDECPEDFDCIYVLNSGVDIAKLCVPETLCIDRDEDGYGTGPACLGKDCDDNDDTANFGHAELCDGVDNDCNGQLNDDPVDEDQPCETGLTGICGEGRTFCDSNREALICLPVNVQGLEICNDQDDDCDGHVDEDEEDDPLSQVCYSGPPGTRGVGECRAGLRVCVDGVFSDCQDQVLPYPELCDGLDNNCVGGTDEGEPEAGLQCDTGLDGVCAAGVTDCSEGELSCVQITTATAESCDGLDNNCNGDTDENNPGANEVCATGQPGICMEGRTSCNSGHLDCLRVNPPDEEETCNYLDDNCDGSIDETFKVGGVYGLDTACGSCLTDCTAIYDKPHAFGVCTLGVKPLCDMGCDGGYHDLNDVPDDGCEFYLDSTAIYVSTLGEDTDDCGLGPVDTVEEAYEPCESIFHALERAEDENRSQILVADGEYQETVTLTAGIDLLGGYRPDTWERHLDSTATVIRGPQGTGHRKAVIAVGIKTETLFEGFTVIAANAISQGANSYGIYVRDSDSNLVIRHNTVMAGQGGPGKPGAAGTSGQIGAGGGNGDDTFNYPYTSCSVDYYFTDSAGSAGTFSCQDPATFPPGVADTYTVANGGIGGAPRCPNRNYQSGSGGNGTSYSTNWGEGGPGGWGHYSYVGGSCYPTPDVSEVGEIGDPGLAASDGSGGGACTYAQRMGRIVSNEWVGYSGSVGAHGTHGRGGGGGGSGGGQRLLDDYGYTVSYDISGGGGGGGSGGCAAERGGYGEAGGGSFAIFIYFPTDPTSTSHIPTVTYNTIIRSYGGGGGSGGNGGAGGDGGAAGRGGSVSGHSGPTYCIFGGASGGAGSRGGHGGGGGGACGGLSYDIFLYNRNSVSYTVRINNNTFPISSSLATGGAAGEGGNSSNTSIGLGVDGQAGPSGNVGIVE